MNKVTINGTDYYVNSGTLLSEFLINIGKSIAHPCGGRGICKKCLVQINGKEELSCRFVISSDITVKIPEQGEIVSESGAEETGSVTDNLCFALDIGTTTLALALISLDEKRIIKVRTSVNPQCVFGADVISRIEYCRKNGTKELHAVLIKKVSEMAESFNVGKVKMLYAAGNTTILHLFFGTDCSSMGVYPYTPVFLESKSLPGEKLGITNVETVISLPSVSAFVGADIVAGLNFIGMPSEGKYNILTDLGTNAEVVLYSGSHILCTAAAAGPCFEGAGISCGMSATDGAVYSYRDNKILTVGDIPPKGICGTGLIDVIADFLRNGIIDETGYMDCEEYEIADGITVEQSDIRQFQLAKSAVYSAVLTLIRKENISFDDIERMYISGGFSSKLNIESAVLTGLLPEELLKKCTTINNSSLLGTVKYAYMNNDLTAFTQKATYTDLSSDPLFSEMFINNMMFEQK